MRRASKIHSTILVSLAGFAAICGWTGLLFIQNNSGRLVSSNVTVQLAIVAVLCGALFLVGVVSATAPILLSARWPVERAFCILTIGVFCIFSYDASRYLLKDRFHLTGVPAQGIYISTAALIVLGYWRLSRFEPARLALCISTFLLAIFALSSVIPIAVYRFRSAPDIDGPVNKTVEGSKFSSAENVYYIILDSYGGAPALKKYLDYDIRPFLDEMHNMGYASIDSARTNYTATYASLAATLEMNYVLGENSTRYLDRGDFFPTVLMQNQLPTAARLVQLAGYDFIHVGNGWAPCHPTTNVSCLNGVNDSTQLRDVVSWFLAPTRIIPFVDKFVKPERIESDALTPFSRMLASLALLKRPSFVFVHHLIPHDFVFADCSRFEGERTKDGYRAAVECVNRSVLSVAHQIEKFDPNAIVIFQADHGSGFGADWKSRLTEWSNAAIDERSSILNLVHVPELCRKWIRPDLSPINTMRLVFGCLERRAPDYLTERTYLVAYETSQDFGTVREVTELLQGR